MSLEAKRDEREIDGCFYRMQPIPFGKGQKLLLRLLRIIAPLMAEATGGGSPEAKLAAALAAFPLALSDADVDAFSSAFGEASWFQDPANPDLWPSLSKAVNSDPHWAGRYMAWADWLAWGVELNFGSFFSGITARGKDLAARAKAMISSGSPPTNG